MMLAARDLCCTEPYDMDLAIKIIKGIQKVTAPVLDESNVQKKLKELNGLGKYDLANPLNALRDAVRRPLSDINSGQTGAGRCGGNWDEYVKILKVFYDVLGVLFGDLSIQEAQLFGTSTSTQSSSRPAPSSTACSLAPSRCSPTTTTSASTKS